MKIYPLHKYEAYGKIFRGSLAKLLVKYGHLDDSEAGRSSYADIKQAVRLFAYDLESTDYIQQNEETGNCYLFAKFMIRANVSDEVCAGLEARYKAGQVQLFSEGGNFTILIPYYWKKNVDEKDIHKIALKVYGRIFNIYSDLIDLKLFDPTPFLNTEE